MQEEHPLAKSPRRGWRRAKLLAGTLALTLAGFGSVAAVSAVPASAAPACGSATGASGCVTNNYTIGAPSVGVNNVTVTPTTATSATSTTFTVTFVAVNALATGNTVTIGTSTALPAPINNSTVALIAGSCLQSGSVPTTIGSTTGVTITLNSTRVPFHRGWHDGHGYVHRDDPKLELQLYRRNEHQRHHCQFADGDGRQCASDAYGRHPLRGPDDHLHDYGGRGR